MFMNFNIIEKSRRITIKDPFVVQVCLTTIVKNIEKGKTYLTVYAYLCIIKLGYTLRGRKR